jgi:hypothetical protein
MKKLFICLFTSFIVICGCLLFINPYTLSPLQFVPIISVIYLFSGLSIYIGLSYLSELPKRATILMSIVLGFSPTVLSALMTLGTVSAIDIVLAITVPALIAWYGIKIKSN